MKEKCLVTGGAGFIGSHLVQKLLEDGHPVRVLDNFSTGKRENLQIFQDDIELVEGDIRNEGVVQKATTEVDWIFHLAALVSVPLSQEQPLFSNNVNIGGTLNLLESGRKSGVQRFVFSSSSAIYGENPSPLKKETLLPSPISLYGVQKAACEQYLSAFCHLYAMATISLRYFNVFGPRQNPDSDYSAVIPKFLSRMTSGQSPIIFGDGNQSRDFVYVEDIVQANLLAVRVDKAVWGGAFNIGSGRALNLVKLVDLLNEILKTSHQPIFDPPRLGDIEHSQSDISFAREKLGYEATFSLKEGLQKTARWFLP